MYKLENIYKTYDKEQTFILNSLNFEFNEGDFIAIIGKSGSGKTTLLNILSTIDTPSKGYYIFNGKNLSKLSSNKLAEFRNESIGVVFQEYNLIPMYTTKQNILLPLIFSKIKKQVNIERILEDLDIVKLEDKKIKYLSGGEQQRVAIGRAVVNKPSLILADEPTGNLDNENSEKIFNILKKLNDSNTTILVVTHDLYFAKKFDKVFELKNGTISEIKKSQL